MAHEIIRSIIKHSKGLIKSEAQFKRTVRGKDGGGYPFLSDREVSNLWNLYLAEFYLAEVSE